MNILVVDDDPQIRNLMTDVLEMQSYVVEAVGSVREALAHRGQPDLLILDRVLKNGDGKRVAKRFAGTPTLYISGYDDLEADLHKPFTMRDLTAAVVQRIGK